MGDRADVVLTKQQIADRLQAIRSDPIEFLKCVKTQDQVDRACPIKHFPHDLEYIREYVHFWLNFPRIAVPKSRRMKMTWTNVALYTWDTGWHIGRATAFVSKKEDDADDLVQRARFIWENMDIPGVPKELIPKCEYKFCELSFPQLNSVIRGFPQGADQLRQFTLSGILADELAFWPDAQKMYAASFPTLEGGGRFTAISSAGPGFFQALVQDKLDELGHTSYEG